MSTGKSVIALLALVALATAFSGCASPTPTVAPTATPTPSPAPSNPPVATPGATPSATPTVTPTVTPAPTAAPVPQTASVAIQNFAFSPQTVKIAAGGSVTWTNQDAATHTITFSDSSETLGHGATYTKTFVSTGSYPYHCSIHPTMTGTVEVV